MSILRSRIPAFMAESSQDSKIFLSASNMCTPIGWPYFLLGSQRKEAYVLSGKPFLDITTHYLSLKHP